MPGARPWPSGSPKRGPVSRRCPASRRWPPPCRLNRRAAMLWSLFKIVLFVVAVAALALIAGWLLEVEGGIRIAVANIELTLGPLQAAIAALLLLLVVWLVLKIIG